MHSVPDITSSSWVVERFLIHFLQEFLWPGVTHESLTEKPFHVYDPDFYDIIGSNPSLTLLASSESDPLFHEAVTWYAGKSCTRYLR